MHDDDALYVCAKGKEEDYTVIDIYIENTETGNLHNLHASAQLAERITAGQKWGESVFWDLRDWGGFWVPFAGTEDTDNGPRTKFLKGSHREIQILRSKFPEKNWNMMISISGVHQAGEYGATFSFPNDAIDTDRSTWTQFQFSR
ncbi:hypothetical protein [Alteromonas flava]|uniref:hypothetical protein n=1 Tax=Alteromonas flava TaxID=2048003 RepID=UPI000C2853C7|nr:hypothetical protein [Alteromonas flava]